MAYPETFGGSPHVFKHVKNRDKSIMQQACVFHLSHSDVAKDARILRMMEVLDDNGFTVQGLGIHDVHAGSETKSFPFAEPVSLRILSKKLWFLPRLLRAPLVLLEFYLKAFLGILKVRPDIVHCHDTLVLPLAVIGKWFFCYKLIYDAHELESDQGSGRLIAKMIWSAERVCWRYIDGFISVSQPIVDWYHSNLGAKRSCVILNTPIIPTGAGAGLPRDYLRKKFNIDPQDLILVYVGMIEDGRGIGTVREALRKTGSGLSFVLVGQGHLRDRMQNDPTLPANIHFHDFVDHKDVTGILATADIGLCIIDNPTLSDYYCLPNKLFEYLFSGLGVIGSDFPEISKVISECDGGLCVDNSVDQLCGAFQDIQKNGWDIRPQQEKLRAYSWSTQAQELLNFFEKI